VLPMSCNVAFVTVLWHVVITTLTRHRSVRKREEHSTFEDSGKSDPIGTRLARGIKLSEPSISFGTPDLQ
jgi:hypothetical protein